MDEVVIEPLTAASLDDFLEFFDRRAFTDNPAWAGCYCYFPYHDPASEDWEDRTAEANRAAMVEAIREGRVGGLLAYAGDEVVGWCNAAPRAAYPALAGLPGDGTVCGATPCFLVAPEWRARGVARRLLEAACVALREEGMVRMEGAPNRHASTARDNCRGPLALFAAAGYEVVTDFPDGTVLVQKVL